MVVTPRCIVRYARTMMPPRTLTLHAASVIPALPGDQSSANATRLGLASGFGPSDGVVHDPHPRVRNDLVHYRVGVGPAPRLYDSRMLAKRDTGEQMGTRRQ